MAQPNLTEVVSTKYFKNCFQEEIRIYSDIQVGKYELEELSKNKIVELKFVKSKTLIPAPDNLCMSVNEVRLEADGRLLVDESYGRPQQ